MLGASGAVALYDGTGSAATVEAAGTVALDGSLHAVSLSASSLFAVIGGGRLVAETITVSGTLVAQAGGGVAAGAVSLAGGTLSVDAASLIALGGIGASGTMTIAAGATLTGHGRINAPLTCDGSVLVAGGVLGLFGAVGGGGTLAIAGGATLFAAAALSGPTIAFAGAAATLEAAGSLNVSLAGLAVGDAIDLALSQAQATAVAAALPVIGAPPSRAFVASADGRGGTLLTVVACFAAGTRIATMTGEALVQNLSPGDMVITRDGPRRLTWTGRSVVTAPELRPVRLRGGALGPGLPRRDLLLSPEHAVLVGEWLVPAVQLVGLPAITRDPASVISYHHIAFATHALVLAEGVWAESYLPETERVHFDEESGVRPLAGLPCRPRVTDVGAAVPRAAGRLRGHVERMRPSGALTRIEGWALDESPPVVLEMRRHGTAVARIVANRWRSDLDRAGLGDGRCGFAATIHGSPIGVTVHRHADGQILPVAAQPTA